MSISQTGFSQQMVAQLRLLNPNYSAEVGTPERWIIDTVAQALADSQIDILGLENALNIDTKFGAALDSFVNLFGFARKTATVASGFVIFSREVASTLPITIPRGTVVQSTEVSVDGSLIQFVTSASITLPAENTKTTAVPISALNPGSLGNVAAETITVIRGAEVAGGPLLGITSVINPTAVTGGSDQEDDNSLKVRFKNTVFRNLAGTEDQYLALAISTAFSTKANVVGPVSRYKEYIQVPKKDDTEYYDYGGGGALHEYSGRGTKLVTVGDLVGTTLTIPSTKGLAAGEYVGLFEEGTNPGVMFTGTIASILSETTLKVTPSPAKNATNVVVEIGTLRAASPTEWTTTLSTIPYAKNIWTSKPVFITNGQSGVANYFFRENVDFNFNFPARLQGDTHRAVADGTGLNPELPGLGKLQPNVTFTNVYVGSSEAVQAIAPEQVVLLEYSYTSASSRNDLNHNVTNCVDVFVDGQNEQPTTTVFAVPTGLSGYAFVENPNSMFYYENYRRDGEPTRRPLIGNLLTPLLREPITSLPEQIQITKEGIVNNYYLGTHYWLVHDVSEYNGTIRARDGIEWNTMIAGDNQNLGPQPKPLTNPPLVTDPALDEPLGYSETEIPGANFLLLPADTPVEVVNYGYDKNILDLQASLEGARQITTDVLAHKARTRYFKLDITVIYEPTAVVSNVNNQIRSVIDSFFNRQYFGAAVNLSDLLQEAHGVPGVKNIRWTSDVPNTSNETRVYETDVNGAPLLGVSIDRIQIGGASVKEKHRLFVMGEPTKGSFTLTYDTGLSIIPAEIPIAELNASFLEAKIGGATGIGVTVVEDKRPTLGVPDLIKSFTITFIANGTHSIPAVITTRLQGESYVFGQDFFLKDNELPALPTGMQTTPSPPLPVDTVPGLIIRPRAQGTWERAN